MDEFKKFILRSHFDRLLLLGIDEKIIDHISKEDPLHQGKYNMTII
jgi:hypothetical protein